MDAPVFTENIKFEQPLLSLTAHGSILAALHPTRLTVFRALAGSSANLQNKTEFEMENALACAFNPKNGDELLVLTSTQLLLLSLSNNARRSLFTFPSPLVSGLVVFASVRIFTYSLCNMLHSCQIGDRCDPSHGS